MDKVNKRLNLKAKRATANHFGITQKEVGLVLRMYSRYVYENINALDLSKDLSEQTNRIYIRNMGDIVLRRPILIKEMLHQGKVDPQMESHVHKWFEGSLDSKATEREFNKILKYRLDESKDDQE